MPSGVIGGIIGSKLSKHIESQYGKSRSYFLSGMACLLISFLTLILFLSNEPTTVTSYERLRIEDFSVSERESRGNYEILLIDGQQIYSLGYSMWKDEYESKLILRDLSKSTVADLWLKEGTTSSRNVRGVKTEFVEINPEIGIQIDNQNRYAILWISLGFLFMGFVSTAYSLILKKKSV